MASHTDILSEARIVIDKQLYENDPIDALEFPTRVLNTLTSHGYKTVGDFYTASSNDLKKIRNVGTKSLKYFNNIKKALREYQKGVDLPSRKIVKTLRLPKQVQSRKFTPYLSEIEKERMRLVKRLYDEHGTLEKVGSLLRLSRERVRQILNKGQDYGLFDYELTRDRELKYFLNKISRNKLVDELKANTSYFDLCSRFDINVNILVKIIKHYNIDTEAYRQSARHKKYARKYSQIVEVLGHHPTTTEMQNHPKWRIIYNAITRLWGGIDQFRSEYGIEKPTHRLHPNTKAYIQKRIEKKQRKKQLVYEILEKNKRLSLKDISQMSGYSEQSVYLYLKEMRNDKEVKKIGSGNNVKYSVV